MNRPLPLTTALTSFALLALLLAPAALAQVASAEIVGIGTTAAHSRGASGWTLDGSVGEVEIVVLALDAAGNPVAGAPVTWTVQNGTENVVYIVDASAPLPAGAHAHQGADLTLDGGVTGADGRAYLTVDSLTAGDARFPVTVGGAEAKDYSGSDMRVVWF